jgi:hypothetical protein
LIAILCTSIGCFSNREFEVDVTRADRFDWNGRLILHEKTYKDWPFGGSHVECVGVKLPGKANRDVWINWERGQPGEIRAYAVPRDGAVDQVLGYHIGPGNGRDPSSIISDQQEIAGALELIRNGQYREVDGFKLAACAERSMSRHEVSFLLSDSIVLRVSRATDQPHGAVRLEARDGTLLYEYEVQELPMMSPANAAAAAQRQPAD